MKKYVFLFLSLTCLLSFNLRAQSIPVVYAHRGCWLGTEVPENSVYAVEMAKRYGYTTIECDVHYTKDSVMVIMHDTNDMRRCIRRKADNSKLDGALKLSDINFDDLRKYYVLASDNPQYRSPVPTLEELLTACKENGITPLLHSDLIESYKVAQQMFGDNWIAFCSTDAILKEARKISNCLILLSMDNVTADQAIQRLKAIGGRIGISSMSYRMFTREFCQAIRNAGFEVQSSIFPTPHDAEAIQNGASILLSDFCYLPNKQKQPSETISIKKGKLQKGEELDKGCDSVIKYGACVLELNFKGSLEVIINQERHYTYTRDKMGTEVIGMRFYEDTPDVRIIAKEDSKIKNGKVHIYRF